VSALNRTDEALGALFLAWAADIDSVDLPQSLLADPADREIFSRFITMVSPTQTSTGCQEWTGYCEQNGYGLIKIDGRQRKATRWILGIARGRPLGRDECALHHCDNPPCVNLDHLYVGDQLQNIRDMNDRGRARQPYTELLAARTHCPQGHPYDEVNTYIPPQGGRHCRACRRRRCREWRQRKAAR
jgi:hypothetical protein